jgi:hypothetical protein
VWVNGCPYARVFPNSHWNRILVTLEKLAAMPYPDLVFFSRLQQGIKEPKKNGRLAASRASVRDRKRKIGEEEGGKNVQTRTHLVSRRWFASGGDIAPKLTYSFWARQLFVFMYVTLVTSNLPRVN